MKTLSAFSIGILFGFGLILSDMSDPSRVLGFLTLTSGAWDPTLAFVMAGAMSVMFVAWAVRRRLNTALLGGPLPSDASPVIDARLVGGAVLFGTGWGLVGLCPGPALTGLVSGNSAILVFTVAMFLGIAFNLLIERHGLSLGLRRSASAL